MVVEASIAGLLKRSGSNWSSERRSEGTFDSSSSSGRRPKGSSACLATAACQRGREVNLRLRLIVRVGQRGPAWEGEIRVRDVEHEVFTLGGERRKLQWGDGQNSSTSTKRRLSW
jgi:hypothetical protein